MTPMLGQYPVNVVKKGESLYTRVLWVTSPEELKDYVKNTLAVVDMQNCNPSSVIGTENQTPLEQEEELKDLDAEQGTLYRKVTGSH